MNRSVHWIALVSLLTLANCGGGGDGAGNASCRSTLKAFEDCGVWEGGVNNCHAYAETQYQICISSCVNSMSCADIEDYVCFDDPNNCLLNCENQAFPCDDGDFVDSVDQCDGQLDCDDGSDEHDCEPTVWRCGVAQGDIEGERVCDGIADCIGGLDEEDCGEYICF